MPTAGVIWTVAIFAELGRRQSYEFTQRLKLRATMSLYFSPHVMQHVLKNPGSMKPQEAELTVLLTDLRNSTAIAECSGSVRAPSVCLTRFSKRRPKRSWPKTAAWNISWEINSSATGERPTRNPTRRIALSGRRWRVICGMESLRPEMPLRVKPLFGYGVALHSGTALLGNKGSAQRLDYGIVGDLINAAARVESLTKHYGVLLLITRETYSRLSNPPVGAGHR